MTISSEYFDMAPDLLGFVKRFTMGQNSSEVVMAKLISVTEAARHSGFTVGYIRRLLIEGRLKGEKVGSFWVIDIQELEKFLAKPRPTGRPPSIDKQ